MSKNPVSNTKIRGLPAQVGNLIPSRKQFLSWSMPSRMSYIAAWASFISLVITFLVLFLDFDVRSLLEAKKEKIYVGAVFKDEQYLSWLEQSFEKKYPRYDLVFVPEIGDPSAPGSSGKRMAWLTKFDNIDVYLGGNRSFYEFDHQAQLSRFNTDPKRFDIPDIGHKNYDLINHKWIGFYRSRIGCVWDTRYLDSIISVNDLFKIVDTLILPGVESSGSRNFLIALSNKDGKFDFEWGSNRLKYLSKAHFWNKMNDVVKASDAEIVGKYSPKAIVTWPHDALKVLADGKFSCLKVSYFKEAPFSLSVMAFSKNNKERIKDGSVLLMRYLLSKEAQRQLFNISYRFPVLEEEYNKIANVLTFHDRVFQYENPIPIIEDIDYSEENAAIGRLQRSSLKVRNFSPPIKIVQDRQSKEWCL